jgi:ATP-dependent exoDNAse (exonuclease V) alpha subunit
LRDGDPTTALDAYFTHKRVHVGTDQHDARRQLVEGYVQRRTDGTGAFDLVALASTRRDVAALNHEIRNALQQRGEVSTDGATVLTDDGPRRFAAGDLVIVTRNDHARELLNGTRATITHTSRTELELRTDTGAAVTVPTGWAAAHLDHGYALTVHKAQGLTTGAALVYGTAALDQQAGYVALSRGQLDNHLYTSTDSLTVDRADIDVDVPRFRVLDHRHPDVRDALADRLSAYHRQVLADFQGPQLDHDDEWQRLRDNHYHQLDRGGHGLEL